MDHDLFLTAMEYWIEHLQNNLPLLQHVTPSRPNPRRREKINLNFYFHSSLWYLKESTTKKCENKNLS